MSLVEREVAVAAALRAFSPAEGEVIYVDRAVRDPGAVILGVAPHVVDVPCLVVFCDHRPGANWMHSCAYAIVEASGQSVLSTVASDRPPSFGRLPVSWIIAADPSGLADLL